MQNYPVKPIKRRREVNFPDMTRHTDNMVFGFFLGKIFPGFVAGAGASRAFGVRFCVRRFRWKNQSLRHAGGRKYFDWIVSENNGLLRPPGGSWRATFGLIPTKENAGPPATPELSKPPERQGRGGCFYTKK
ncbi:MAG: hypothetical protein D6714_09145 [Bacteroidetes bacterium]|nr:MAG: hypothetical protein D6714_09145 [Bacteroidota bacterium]